MKIISIINQKGGIGKTTTALNMAAGLGIKNKKVLLIDIDSQANLTRGIGIDNDYPNYDVYDLIISKDLNPKKLILKTTTKNVDVVPSSMGLAGIEIQLVKDNRIEELIFLPFIEKIKKEYDYVIFDCPPALGLMSKNALSISNSLIIPMQADYFSLEGLSQLLETISIVKKRYNRKLYIDGILLTKFNKRINFSKEIEKELNIFFKDKILKTRIPINIKLAESPSSGQSIFDYDKNCKGARAYESFVDEFLQLRRGYGE